MCGFFPQEPIVLNVAGSWKIWGSTINVQTFTSVSPTSVVVSITERFAVSGNVLNLVSAKTQLVKRKKQEEANQHNCNSVFAKTELGKKLLSVLLNKYLPFCH